MSEFEVHTIDTAPAASVPFLQSAQQTMGFVPNLIGVLAESPAAVEAYLTLMSIFEKSSLTPIEQQVAILAISRTNECDYCMAAHSVVASMQNVPADVIQAIRNDKPIGDEKLEVLRTFAATVIESKKASSTEEDTNHDY